MKERVYSIKDLEVLSGIKAHTIRIWEKRYNLLEPNRTDTNIRFYGDNDLKRLLNISFLVSNGYKISKLSQLDDQSLSEIILEHNQKPVDENSFLDRLTLHMVNFDGLEFTRLTEEAIATYGFNEAVKKIFFPFFEKIGVFWQVGSIFPAQEHYISNLFRQKLLVEIDKFGPGTHEQKIMLFFLHEDEMHELSLLYYSYYVRAKGYQVYYLGQNIPMDDLRRMGKMEQIDSVFTVFINPIPKDDLESYLVDMKEIFGNRKIFISGLQVKELNPQIPAGITAIESYHDMDTLL